MSRRPQTKGKTETQNKIVDQLKNYNGMYKGILDMHEISGKALNIKEQHLLYYPFKEITNHKNHNSMILNELGDIAYDND